MAEVRNRWGPLGAIGIATLVGLGSPSAASAQEASPIPDVIPEVAVTSTWPSGDELRRELQAIGFGFRVDRGSGDWLGSAPRATPIEAPAITLGADGSAPAWARATFQTLETDLFGSDADGALTGLLETASRTPLPQAEVHRAFRFVVDDLLVDVPVLQAECYATVLPEGVIVIRLDTETGAASVLLAESAAAHSDGDAVAECSPISARVREQESGLSRDERVTIVATADGVFEPAHVTLVGPLVTVVLTVRNDSAVERTLTFPPPLEATSGPLAPGASTLIVLRRIEVGEYRFGDPADGEMAEFTLAVVDTIDAIE